MYRILKFCVNANILVSFASFSLYRVTELLFDFKDLNLGLFVFFSTLFAYNYMRLPVCLKKGNVQTMVLRDNHKIIYYILFTSAVAVVFLLSILGFKFLKLVFPAIIISLLYPLSISINKKEYSIRKIPFLKIFLIALTWSYITLLIPALYYNLEIDYFLLDMFFQRVLFIIAISIPFDIRDYNIDNIKTIPNTLGIYESKLFAWFCLFIIDVLLIVDLINNTITMPFFIALFLSIELCSLLIYYANPNRSLMFYGLFVESLSIIMCLFVSIASFF